MKRVTVPEAKAVLVEAEEGYLWRVPVCPLCGEEHTHGAGTLQNLPQAYLGHRSPHCMSARGGAGYVLVEAKP